MKKIDIIAWLWAIAIWFVLYPFLVLIMSIGE
jgi:hypothetical protein